MCITKDNFREIVTFQRRYPRCELKIVPQIDGASALKSDSPATSTPHKSAPETDEEEQEDIQQETNSEEILDVLCDATSQKKSKPSASQPNKKRNKTAKETAA